MYHTNDESDSTTKTEVIMTTDKIKKLIDDRGITVKYLAKKANISTATLYNRMSNIGDFRASEITNITNALRLSREERDDIFFKNQDESDLTTKGAQK